MDFSSETCLFLFFLSPIFSLFSKTWPKPSIALNKGISLYAGYGTVPQSLACSQTDDQEFLQSWQF